MCKPIGNKHIVPQHLSITYRWKFLVTHGGVQMGDGLHTNSLKCMWRNKDSHEDCGWERNVFINRKVGEFQRIHLSPHGFYSTPHIVFDWLLSILQAVYRIIFRFGVYCLLFWSSKVLFLNHYLIKMSWGKFCMLYLLWLF